MTVKKTILIFLGASLVITTGVIGYLYYKLNQSGDLSIHVPKRADKVYFFNSGNIIRLLLSNKLKHGFETNEYQKNEYLKDIPDLKKTGIAFLEGAAFVEYKGISYAILPLEDAGKLADNIARIDRQLLTPAEDHQAFRKVFAKRDSFTLAWNKDLLVFFLKSKKHPNIPDEYIREILEIKKDSSFASNAGYVYAKKDDALAWFYHAHADLRISDPSALKGYLMYDSSFSLYATSNIEKPYNNANFHEPNNAAHNFIYADTANGFTNKMIMQLVEIFIPNEMQKIKPMEFNKYRKVFLLQGRQEVENRMVSYVYDDNFNKQAVETIKKDTVQKAFFTIVATGSLWGASFCSLPKLEFDSTFDIHTIPGEVKLMAHFDQDFTQTVFPLDFNYNIRFNYRQEGGFNEYRLRFKVDNLKAVFNARMINQAGWQ